MIDRVYVIIDEKGQARTTVATEEAAKNVRNTLVPDARIDCGWTIHPINRKHLNKIAKACQQWLSGNILNIKRLEKVPSGEHMMGHLIETSEVQDSAERIMERIDDWVDGLSELKACSSGNPTSDTEN